MVDRIETDNFGRVTNTHQNLVFMWVDENDDIQKQEDYYYNPSRDTPIKQGNKNEYVITKPHCGMQTTTLYLTDEYIKNLYR